MSDIESINKEIFKNWEVAAILIGSTSVIEGIVEAVRLETKQEIDLRYDEDRAFIKTTGDVEMVSKSIDGRIPTVLYLAH